jgi:hypothetical protein
VNCASNTALFENELAIDDGLDIPSFLKISQEQRAEYWLQYDAARKADNDDCLIIDDRGPGAVCRRLGIPDGINQEFVAAIKGREEAARLAKREEGLARLAEWKARTRAEKDELNAIKARARARHRKG